MEGNRIMPWVIFVAVLSLLLFGLYKSFDPEVGGSPISSANQHLLLGKWRHESFGSIIVYSDQTASVNGFKFPWISVDQSAIRFELELKKLSAALPDLVAMADFRLLQGGGETKAVLNFIGQDIVFDRVKEEGQTPEQSSF